MESIKTQLVLITPTGKTRASARIDITYKEDGDPSAINIRVTLNGVDYFGTGRDYLWVDAFADLQRNLPQNVKLACCMTCRHGNMCPYGNKPRQLFCTKDLIINSKNVITVFDNHDAYEKREVSADTYCDDFVYQSDDCYTYNDYLYYLKKNDNYQPFN